jgi:tetratricopeptide (TPR) repeat protein
MCGCALFLASCVSRINVTVTPPEARLSVENASGGESVEIGLGSASIDAELLAQRSIRVPFLLRAVLPGRAPLAVLVAALPSGEQSVVLSLPLIEGLRGDDEAAPNDDEKSEQSKESASLSLRVSNPAVWNQTVRSVLEAERYLSQQEYDRALAMAQSMQEKTPWLAIAFVLEASAHYLKGDRARARVALERATTLDPEDASSQQMLRTIDQELGLPADGATPSP